MISSDGRGEGLPPTKVNIPQFSAFDFGEPKDSNGIPVQEATTAQADRYAAYAYQAILEHSAHIFQAGMRHNEDLLHGQPYRDFKYLPYVATLTTGEKAWITEGSSGISGIWKGKAYGIEGGGYRHHTIIGGSDSLPSLDSTNNRIVTANVEITANIGKDEPLGSPGRPQEASSNSELDMRFYNWKGGTVSYPDLAMGTKQGGKISVLSPIDHVLIDRYDSPAPPSGNWIVGTTWTGARFQFYGPDGAEVAGYWWATWEKGGNNRHIVHGGFVAKK